MNYIRNNSNNNPNYNTHYYNPNYNIHNYHNNYTNYNHNNPLPHTPLNEPRQSLLHPPLNQPQHQPLRQPLHRPSSQPPHQLQHQPHQQPQHLCQCVLQRISLFSHWKQLGWQMLTWLQLAAPESSNSQEGAIHMWSKLALSLAQSLSM